MNFKILFSCLMGFGYIWVGVSHFYNTEFFLKIMPPSFPFHLEAVYVSGFFEILFGTMLLYKKTRFLAGWGLIMLLVAVYPANIYLAQTNGAAMDISATIAWARLPIQFIFIGIAYWHSKIN